MSVYSIVNRLKNNPFIIPEENRYAKEHWGEIVNLHALNFSFSQDGEDIILDALFEGKKSGFYVDLGAFDPIRFSNTLKFYAKGWKGMNVDATPGSMKAFERLRSRDINVEAGISKNGGGTTTYFEFNDGALNTFDPEAAARAMKSGYKLVDKQEVRTYTINELMDQYIPEGQVIDFIDIDVEGFDKIIVSQINWQKYKPTAVITETANDQTSDVERMMTDYGYTLRCRTMRNEIYLRK